MNNDEQTSESGDYHEIANLKFKGHSVFKDYNPKDARWDEEDRTRRVLMTFATRMLSTEDENALYEVYTNIGFADWTEMIDGFIQMRSGLKADIDVMEAAIARCTAMVARGVCDLENGHQNKNAK